MARPYPPPPSIVAGPLRKYFFCGFPNSSRQYHFLSCGRDTPPQIKRSFCYFLNCGNICLIGTIINKANIFFVSQFHIKSQIRVYVSCFPRVFFSVDDTNAKHHVPVWSDVLPLFEKFLQNFWQWFIGCIQHPLPM